MVKRGRRLSNCYLGRTGRLQSFKRLPLNRLHHTVRPDAAASLAAKSTPDLRIHLVVRHAFQYGEDPGIRLDPDGYLSR